MDWKYNISYFSLCSMIDWFCRPYFTVRLTKFKTLFELKFFPSVWTHGLCALCLCHKSGGEKPLIRLMVALHSAAYWLYVILLWSCSGQAYNANNCAQSARWSQSVKVPPTRGPSRRDHAKRRHWSWGWFTLW